MRQRTLALLAATLIVAASCGSDESTSDSTTETSETAAPTEPTSATSDTTGSTTGPSAATLDATSDTNAVTTPDSIDRGGPAPLTIPEGMGSAQGEGVFPRAVAHYKGRTVLESTPERIIAIGTGQLDVMLTLGLIPVGAVQREGADVVQPYLVESHPELSTELARIQSVGTNSAINYEAIAALQPDLILDNGGAEAEGYDKLAAIAPTVITAGTGVNWKQDFLLLASAVGRSAVAEQFMSGYHSAADAMASSVADDPPTASFVRFNVGRARMFGIPSFAGSIAFDAGIDRPHSQQFDSTSQDLSEEQINLMDADWVFYSVQGVAAETPAEAFIANPLWANLAAVKAGHVTIVPDDPWYLSAGPTAAMIVLNGLIDTLSP